MMPAPECPETGTSGDVPQPSVFGLSIVSGLNVVSLAFIAYHYASHPDVPLASPIDRPTTGDLMTAGKPWPPAGVVAATASALGNVDLSPAARQVLEIASGIMDQDSGLAERQDAAPEPVPQAAGTPENTDDHAGYWVQLGALSDEETARRYWSTLKRRHAVLLQNQEPRYFGPADGGDLYHIRLGPLEDDAASGLCAKLEADGADCFCVRPSDERS